MIVPSNLNEDGDMGRLEVALHEVATITMGTSPKGTTYNHDGIGLPLLNGPTEFGETHPHCTLYTTDSKRECSPRDLLFCVRGSTGRMNWADKTYSLGRGVCSIRGETSLDTRFIRYSLEWKLGELLNFSTGATFSNLKKNIINEFLIPYPKSRHKISRILSNYDELIEINHQRIALLERAGREIYHEWFVRLRFPGHERTKMVDGVPQGWELLKVGNLLGRTKSKKKIKKNAYLDSGLFPCVDQSRDFIGGYTDDVDAVHETPLPVVVFGDHTRIVKFIDFPFARGADGTQLLTPNRDDISVVQFYFALDAIDLSDYFYARHFKFLKHQMMLVPPKTLGDRFTEFAAEIMKQIKILREQNRELSRARDLLLPRLMSGKLEV